MNALKWREYIKTIPEIYRNSFDGCKIDPQTESIKAFSFIHKCAYKTFKIQEIRVWPGGFVSYFNNFLKPNDDAIKVVPSICKNCGSESRPLNYEWPQKTWADIRKSNPHSELWLFGIIKCKNRDMQKIGIPNRAVHRCKNCKNSFPELRDKRISELKKTISKAESELARLEDEGAMKMAAKNYAAMIANNGWCRNPTTFFQTVNAAAQITKHLATV